LRIWISSQNVENPTHKYTLEAAKSQLFLWLSDVDFAAIFTRIFVFYLYTRAVWAACIENAWFW